MGHWPHTKFKIWRTTWRHMSVFQAQFRTSGIPGGYRLVSTYDLPGCKTILKFEIWSFSNFFGGGGVFWNSQIWTLWQFSFWGEGGILKLSDLDSDNFHLGGILKLSDLDSLTIFILGGYSETLRFGLSDNFHFGGYSETLGIRLSDNFHWGVFWNSWIWTLWQFSFLGGVFWNSRIWTLWQFSFLGGYSELQNRGYSEDFGPKFQPL